METPAIERKKRTSFTGLEIPKQLSEIKKIIPQEKNSVAEETPIVYTLNPSVQIDKELFKDVLVEYIQRLEKENRQLLATTLQSPAHHLSHNQWTLVVPNELHRNMIEKEAELLPFLRQKIGVPDIFIVIEVAKEEILDKKPLTDSEKLVYLSQQNPALLELQKLFKTRLKSQ